MPNLTQLRFAAREIFDETLRAVDAGDAIRRSARLDGSHLNVGDTTIDIGGRRIYSIAIGKAAFTMAHALEPVLGDSFAAGFMSGAVLSPSLLGPPPMHPSTLSTPWRSYEGGHPLPKKTSFFAATAAFARLPPPHKN